MSANVLELFHPATRRWFERAFPAPTPAQIEAWPVIVAGESTLIAAPTGSGKTLAAFLAAIDALVREAQKCPLPDETRILYISPLKALSNDVHRNLEAPLAGIAEVLAEWNLENHGIRAAVRTGDTTPAAREAMRRIPPHILVTTPESLFILMTSERGREMLKSVRSFIIDEIHALVSNKRGAHLALTIARLEGLVGRRLIRIGLSATQKPLEKVAAFLMGNDEAPCRIVDSGHVRERDLALALPRSPLTAIMSAEVWGEIYDQIADWSETHKTLLVFANQRRAVERVARFLGERIGTGAVAAHHGSLAKEQRLDAEQRLKSGALKIMVATASLELGIDIGDVELVVQLGSPRSISTFLQRVGRANHSVDGVPKARLVPLSRDDLVECTALLAAVRAGELDSVRIPWAPVDVLAQQLIAEVACGERSETELLAMTRAAYPYRELSETQFGAVLDMLGDSITTRRGRKRALLHRDVVNAMVRAREGARLAAVTNAGAIPDLFDYDVVLEPEGLVIGTLNEDFAFESIPGDIFQLGNQAYRLLKVEQGKVRVADAAGASPTIPFWFGESPGRVDELSRAVSELRQWVDDQLETSARETVTTAFARHYRVPMPAAAQLVDYLAEAKAALGSLPTRDTLVFERFFDGAGDQHLVIHASFGSRINRAWGLSLRKRFCRTFNFELQAAALDDCIILSLGVTHSFELASVARYLHPDSVRQVLIQALLDAPMFGTRWRWNANTALAVLRFRGGKRVPPQFQRSEAEDLIALVFPDQLACLENIQGEREVPDHPLVQQTIDDCLHEVMDIDGLEAVLKRLLAGDIRVVTRELAGPSPLAMEVIGARPYAFLDGAPAEERRTLNIESYRFGAPEEAIELGRLDPAAVARVREEAWPATHSKEDLHEALVLLGLMTDAEVEAHGAWLLELGQERRVEALALADGSRRWVAAERLSQFLALHPGTTAAIQAAGSLARREWNAESACLELTRSRLEAAGPIGAEELAPVLGIPRTAIDAALLHLEQEGFALRGRFTSPDEQWCERGLLARMQRYSLQRQRAQVKPVSAADYFRFLLHWQGLIERAEGEGGLLRALSVLEGWQAPVGAWESELLPLRVRDFLAVDLDRLCTRGRMVWARLSAPPEGKGKTGPVKMTPVAVLPREHQEHWRATAQRPDPERLNLGHPARAVLELLRRQGALFFDDLVRDTGLLRTQVEAGLGELVAAGLVTADSFDGLRILTLPASRRGGSGRRRVRGRPIGLEDAGRWSLVRWPAEPEGDSRFSLAYESLEHIARCLLRRYGVVFRAVLARESNLPPWRDLLYVFRRLEARSEVRGGRFVAGFAGEQFALQEAAGLLRDADRGFDENALVSLSASDPLNLVGIIVPGPKVPAIPGNRILFRHGLPVAVHIAGESRILAQVEPSVSWQYQNALVRQA